MFGGGELKEAMGAFDQVIDESGDLAYTKYLEAILGKIKLLELQKDYKNMVEYLNDLLVKAPRFIPGMIEKLKAQVLVGN